MHDLGPLGQIPSVGCYIVPTLGFSIRDEDEKVVASLLEKTAVEITKSYTWLAGQVVNVRVEDEIEPNSGTYRVVEYPPHQQASSFVHVKNCKNLCPSYSDIIEARAPMSVLDGKVISPAYGFPCVYPNDVAQPVILMQANFVQGGLLLTSCGHHKTMDANGHEQFLRQFASLCRGEKLLEEHVRLGNADQSTIIPPLKPGEEPAQLEMFRCPSTLNDQSAASVAALKTEALKNLAAKSDVTYVSSNDALTAFIFTRLTAVRSKTLPKNSRLQLIRAVNGRRRLDVPIGEGYMGHSTFCPYTTLHLSDILEEALSSTAVQLRRTLTELNDHQMRSFFHLLKSEKDRTTINYGAKFNVVTDLFITSFIAQQLHTTGFGNVLEMPDFVRRPKLPDGKGLCYMFPKSRQGDVDIMTDLTDDEYEGLKADAKWREFAAIIE